jgi:hypothetical protein
VPMPEGLAANSVASFADGSIVRDGAVHARHDVCRRHRRPQADGGRCSSGRRATALSSSSRARSCRPITASSLG